MNNILQDTYIIESILVSGILYSIYLIGLRNSSTLVFNRILLLVISFLGFLVPFLNFSLPQNSTIPTSSILLEGVTIILSGNQTLMFDILNWKTIYFVITVIFLVHFIFQIIHIFRLGQNSEGDTFKIISGKYPHFSFFNRIFINTELIQSKNEMDMIIEHEKVHVKQMHSIDILLFEILKIFLWFNPFIWLIKNLAVENHEYLADKGMLKTTTINIYDYFNELLQSTLFNYNISIVNNFNNSLLKKRIKMITKQNFKRIERFIPLLIIPIFLLVGVFFACTDNILANEASKEQIEGNGEVQEEESIPVTQLKDEQKINYKGNFIEGSKEKYGEVVYVNADILPKFNGESHQKFITYIQDNLVYPEEAKKQNIQGKVYIQFIVSSKGEIIDAKIARGINKILDEEALKIIKSSPKWTPAMLENGENIAVQFTCPVSFVLN